MLPVQATITFELVVNGRPARELGLIIQISFLAGAEEVIE